MLSSAATPLAFPTTRYQGSKRKSVRWIGEHLHALSFETALDVFGGTGAISHCLKGDDKCVTYNDALAFNWNIGMALIENRDARLSPDEIDALMQRHAHLTYPDFIQRTFAGIYFTDDENQWLDTVVWNIRHLLSDPYKQALARFAVFQAALAKRPYNLFHRANLYMRAANVSRGFGNKITWDTPFPVHFRAFAAEANAAVFDNGRANRAIQVDALDTPTGADVVYLDPPYINAKGVGVDYRNFYHFLEGMMHYDEWGSMIHYASKHRRLQPRESAWTNPKQIVGALTALIERHQHSMIVLSYRDDGIPSSAALIALMERFKRRVHAASQPIQYRLSQKRSHELLIIGV
jgi:adenine-specific DNA methylase